MSLTPPCLRHGSVPARELSHGGRGGSEAAPPTPPSRRRVTFGVVQAGSFIAASKELGIPKSTVSRKLAELEERLLAELGALCRVGTRPRTR